MFQGETCCWVCNDCLAYEYMEDEYTCTDCGVGRWPNHNKSSCFDIEVTLKRPFCYLYICNQSNSDPIHVLELSICHHTHLPLLTGDRPDSHHHRRLSEKQGHPTCQGIRYSKYIASHNFYGNTLNQFVEKF